MCVIASWSIVLCRRVLLQTDVIRGQSLPLPSLGVEFLPPLRATIASKILRLVRKGAKRYFQGSLARIRCLAGSNQGRDRGRVPRGASEEGWL